MLKNRIFYAVLLSAAIAFSMLYKSGVSAIILAIVLAYPFVAAAAAALQLPFLKADFAEGRLSQPKNERFDFSINVRNASILPCTPLELVCTIPDAESGRFVRKLIYASLSPLSTAKLAVNGRHLYRGCYTATLDSISTVDPLRIIRLTKKQNKSLTLVFLPRKLAIDDVISSGAGEQNYSLPNAFNTEKEDFSHVRDYRAGDNIQLAHWKLTAKQDELMIKQYDSVKDKRIIVMCDWSRGDVHAAPVQAPPKKGIKRTKGSSGQAGAEDGVDLLLRADTIIETALAFVKSALDGEIHSTVQMGGACEYRPISVTTNSEYEMFYDTMSVLPATADGRQEDFIALLDGADMRASAVVIITANLTRDIILRCEEYAGTSEVYLAYINLENHPTDKALYEKPFFFLDIRAPGEEALRLAVSMAKNVD